MNALLLISSFLSLFFSVFVFLKKKKTHPDFLLAYWLLFTAIHMFIVYAQYYNYEHNFPFPYLIGIDISLVAVHPIWIFLYIMSYIRPGRDKYRVWWHILPIIVLNLVLLKTFYLRSNGEKIESYQSAMLGTGYVDKSLEFSVLLVICISLAYLIASYWLLKRHVSNVKNHYSTLDGVDLKWLRVLLFSIAAVIIVNTLSEWTRNYLDIIPAHIANNIGLSVIAIGISYVGFHGIRQTTIFTDYEPIQIENKFLKNNKSNLANQKNKTPNSENFTDEDYEKLIRQMENIKPYLDIDLNLLALAKQTGFKSRDLSQMINQKSGKNFFDFVNAFRIKEFKHRVRQPENSNFTLLSIAYDCGFNSKATFNRVFKNHTGYTPSEFYNNPNLV
jgi:AraC-like DNA-binding protein